jgi:hypothetical protein
VVEEGPTPKNRRRLVNIGPRWFAFALPLLLLIPAGALAKPAAPSSAPADSLDTDGIAVLKLVICLDVVDRVPVEAARSFPRDVGKLFAFSEVDRAEAPTRIFHRWYVGERLVTEVPIEIGAAHWRCWTTKTILAKWLGPCRVEVVTEGGEILARAGFTLE